MSTETKTWRVAYIGAGAIVQMAHIPNFKAIPNTESVAICDVNEARANEAAAAAGIPAVYSDHKKMLAEVKPDIVVVATPNVFHKPQAIDALEAGCHVLCEKPVAPTLADAREMFETARRVGKSLTVGTHFRFGANLHAARQQVDGGFFGKIYAARTTWHRRSGIPGMGGWFTNKDLAVGGVLLDLGVHALDRALYLMDYPKPVAVSGASFAELGPRNLGAGGWGMDAMSESARKVALAGSPRFDVDDLTWALVRFDNGAVLQLQVAWAAHFPDHFQTEILGSDGGALISDSNSVVLYSNLNGALATTELSLPAGPKSTYGTLAANFVRHLEGDPDANIVTEAQALVHVAIVDGIFRSAALGREVEIEL